VSSSDARQSPLEHRAHHCARNPLLAHSDHPWSGAMRSAILLTLFVSLMSCPAIPAQADLVIGNAA
jgi:hypothetical protein